MRPAAVAALLLAAAALTGCETTAEKSAKLEKLAKRQTFSQQKGLSIAHQSAVVKVTSASLVHGSEGAAVLVTLHNGSAKAQRALPIAITVKDASGSSVYTNSTPGLSATLVSVALLPAHGALTWIDDQVTAPASARSVSARIGEGAAARGAIPQLRVAAPQLNASPSGVTAEGMVVNDSRVTQQELVVYALARRAGRIVAAGRAVLASVPAGASTPFQVFFIGDPRGAQLQVDAPATTLG